MTQKKIFCTVRKKAYIAYMREARSWKQSFSTHLTVEKVQVAIYPGARGIMVVSC